MISLSRKLYITLFAWVMFTVSSYAYASNPFVIDTDMVIDDAIAILYLLNSPNVDIKAITVGTGNVACDPAATHTKQLLLLMKRDDIPVACGRSVPLRMLHAAPNALLGSANTLGGTSDLLPPTTSVIRKDAVNLLTETLMNSKEPVTILAIGPLTNIAEALLKTPAIKSHIKTIYVMGGAVNVPGNMTDVDTAIPNKVAEWNIHLDPYAAKIVFDSHLPIVLVPLDLTNQLPIDMNFYQLLSKNHHTVAANYVFEMFKRNLDVMKAMHWYFWDPLAAVIGEDPSIATYKKYNLSVVLKPESQSGRTTNVPGQHNQVLVAEQVNAETFKNKLLTVLNKQ